MRTTNVRTAWKAKSETLPAAGWSLTPAVNQAKSTWNLCLSAIFLFALLPLAGCGPKTPVAADQPVAVRLRAPNRVQQPVSVAVSGTVEANVTAQSAFQIAGRVARVFVEDGQAVSKGQVLAELDSTDYSNAYDAAQGQADAARAVEIGRASCRERV